MWTLKEAYTKALGLGLGFDFKKIEYNVLQGEVKVDGIAPTGWRFTTFRIKDGDDLYQGVVAERTGDTTELIEATSKDLPWLRVVEARRILRDAVELLSPL
jgi:4'-phosphopantetheinyl transferase